MQDKPEVTILLATYNGEKYIRDLLDSLDRQTYENWELIVLDDCSTDSTIEIIKNHRINLKHRVLIEKNKVNIGGKATFIELLSRCKGEYALFCDQDDVWNENKIYELMKVMNREEKESGKTEPIMVHCDMRVVDHDLSEIDNSFYHYAKYPLKGTLQLHMCMNEIPGCTMMINNSLLSLCLRDVDSSKIIMHDSWIALIAYSFGKVVFVDKQLMLYRQHTNNTVGAANARQLKYQIHRIFDRKRLKYENRMHVDEVAHFMSVYEATICNESEKEMLARYARLREQSLFMYIFVCIKYKILKYPASRAFFQLLSGCNE